MMKDRLISIVILSLLCFGVTRALDDKGDTLSTDEPIKLGDATETENNENKLLAWDAPLAKESAADDSAGYNPLYRMPFTELYDIGVGAYLENNWNDCIVYLEIAVHEFKVYRQAVVNCRLQCAYQSEREEPFYDVKSDNLQFYDLMLKRTFCLNSCYKKVLKPQYLPPFFVSQYYFERFNNLRPYEYLQLCYYRDTEYEKAASATYTVLMHNLENSLQMSNMQFYLKEQKVDISKVKDLEEQPFVQQFMDGMDAYHKENFEQAINILEESLLSYLMSQDECRAFCDGEFDHAGWQPDFISAIGNHFIYGLYCKQNCTRDLNNIRGEAYDNVLTIHYEYLQFAYFKIGDIQRACRAVSSFLLFYPDDEEMLYNVKYYRTEHQAAENYFKARSEATRFYQRAMYEKKLLQYALTEFNQLYGEDMRKRAMEVQLPSLLQLYAKYSTNVTDEHGNGACLFKISTNLFKSAVLQMN
ncbi:prolyl 3-hydroxylase 1-like [Culicoides brevitarsis]|uniref:prolyl 3-hydroxylase 1-like n=1 Tax=Culicoides brevitarsis TaxID=469753 RepID=UPI00307B6FDF